MRTKILYTIGILLLSGCNTKTPDVTAYTLPEQKPVTSHPLNPLENGTSSKTDGQTWSVNFSQYTLSGRATCSSIEGPKYGAAGGTDERIIMAPAGLHCWCQMIIPQKTTYWTYSFDLNEFGDDLEHCNENCTRMCTYLVREQQTFREYLFDEDNTFAP